MSITRFNIPITAFFPQNTSVSHDYKEKQQLVAQHERLTRSQKRRTLATILIDDVL